MSSGSTSKLRVSHSSIVDFLRCQRRWYLKWVARIDSVTEDVPRPLDFGRAFHAGQEAWWTAEGTDAGRLRAAHFAFAKYADGLSWEDRVMGTELLRGYAAYYANDELRFHNVPTAEQKVILPVLDPDGNPDPDLEYTVVFDVVGYAPDASTVLVEHKTTKSDLYGVSFWRRFERSLQLPLQWMAASDCGRTPAKLIIDAVKAPQLKRAQVTPPENREFYKVSYKGARPGDPKPNTRLKAETREEFEERISSMILDNPEGFFARQEYFFDARALEMARLDLWSVARSMLQVARSGGYSPRNADGCSKYGGTCEYEPACWSGADLTDSKLFTIRGT